MTGEQFCISHIGGRPNHEDNFLFGGEYITPDEQKEMGEKQLVCRTEDTAANVRFFAVCDGMGGHSAGEIASHICVARLAELEAATKLPKGFIQNMFMRLCAVPNRGNIKEVVALCQKTISDINDEICAKGREIPAFRGMGATLVLLVMRGSECAVLNIGDSRAYFFDGANLAQITKDHTVGQRMLDLNILTHEELMNFPDSKNLNRYIGFDEPGFRLEADEYFIDAGNGFIMLCSDGVSDSLTDAEIEEYLRTESNVEAAARNIIEQAVAKQDSDNATVIIVSTGE